MVDASARDGGVTVATSADASSRIRTYIFEYFRDHAVPPVVEQVMTAFALSREEAGEALRGLETARHLALVKGTERVLMAFPFSAIATAFRVTVGERRYFANCAWDAISFHAMLGEDVRVESFCHHCAAPIEIELRDGRAVLVEPAAAIVYLAVPAARWWDDIIETCSNTMVFFASPEHRDASSLCSGTGSGASLTPDQVHALSVPLYAGRMSAGFARPSKDELLDHFASLGLTSEFWAL